MIIIADCLVIFKHYIFTGWKQIVYTPLNGSGLKCVLQTLEKNGFHRISMVKEQEQPDGYFPTCPYPNPEMKEALELGLRDAERTGSDLLLATDPDCDRVGIAVRRDGGYVLLSGNEVGLLLLDYICKGRIALGQMPERPVLINTIVTTDLAKRIADDYGVSVIDVLTGFKYIGEQIGFLEAEGGEDRFILGLSDVLEGLYKTYGYCLNTLHSYTFEGADGFRRMQGIMKELREGGLSELGGMKIIKMRDYSLGLDGLPQSDVVKYLLEGGGSAVVRPSGTEPKIKVYLSVCALNCEEAARLEKEIAGEMEQSIHLYSTAASSW